MPLSIDPVRGREAFVAQTQRLLEVTGALDDHALLSASRGHGWAVLDVVVHVRVGLEEMLRGAGSPGRRSLSRARCSPSATS